MYNDKKFHSYSVYTVQVYIYSLKDEQNIVLSNKESTSQEVLLVSKTDTIYSREAYKTGLIFNNNLSDFIAKNTTLP